MRKNRWYFIFPDQGSQYYLIEKDLPGKALELGNYFMDKLRSLKNPVIKEVRGKGLLIGLELKEKARLYAEQLKEKGLLCKETHSVVIRFAPPLIITKEELDWAFEQVQEVFKEQN